MTGDQRLTYCPMLLQEPQCTCQRKPGRLCLEGASRVKFSQPKTWPNSTGAHHCHLHPERIWLALVWAASTLVGYTIRQTDTHSAVLHGFPAHVQLPREPTGPHCCLIMQARGVIRSLIKFFHSSAISPPMEMVPSHHHRTSTNRCTIPTHFSQTPQCAEVSNGPVQLSG